MAAERRPHGAERRPGGSRLGELVGLAHLRAGAAAVKRLLAAAALLAALAAPARAHDQPYSFLDLRLSNRALEGTVTAHVFDLAHEIALSTPDSLLDPA